MSCKNSIILSLLIISLIFLSYYPVLHAPFVFDDIPNIEENRILHLTEFSSDAILRMLPVLKTRPLGMFSFAINHYFGGLDTYGYHLTNIIIHILAAFALFSLIQTLLINTAYQNQSIPIAAFTALLFAAHPVQTQAVSYIIQRLASLAALFYFLALWAYLKGRSLENVKWYILCAFFALCSLAVKEISATLPVFIFLGDYCLKQAYPILSQDKKKKKAETKPPQKKSRYWWVIAIGILAVLLSLYTNFDWAKIFKDYQKRDFTPQQRLLTQLRVVVYYLSLLIWPLPGRLNLDYDFPLSYSLLNPPTTFFCLLFLISLLILSFYLFKKKEPLLAFCIWWYLGNLVIESSVIPLEMVFEHRLYLPSAGVFLFFALLMAKAWQYLGIKESTAIALILPLILLLLRGTYQRNRVWSSELNLWKDITLKSPRKSRPHLSLGAAYTHLGRYPEAVREYEAALSADPYYAKAYYNLAIALEKQRAIDQAIINYEKCLKLDVNYGEAYNNLGGLYLLQGRLDEAEKAFKNSLRLKPDFFEIRANLAAIYLQRGQKDLAKAEFLTLLQQKPDFGEVHFNLATIYMQEQDYVNALRHLEIARRIQPRQPPLDVIDGLIWQVKQMLSVRE
ncbi:MAG: tetratricopeptide repeat protein [Candidatus Schekmanbacteria bacterium]|nr:tetratricopeptide repeat protein [Candidatus Schekmanbacteria bacterium]